MKSGLLIDAIVRQTTVLLAQLSTAAGIRAPLAHVADEVFVSLAREIEAQGIGRKVMADMFGLALRTYQKKVQRLTESAKARNDAVGGHPRVRDRGGKRVPEGAARRVFAGRRTRGRRGAHRSRRHRA